ncbi:MAG TPA: amidase [bacterium]|nr:amidase [bacterium]
MSLSDLVFLPATEQARLIREKQVSCLELMQAHLAQIARVNPRVNAIVTLLPERALEGAKAADAALARGEPLGPLHGLPIAHKDMVETAGIRTTYGSPIYADNVPTQDALIVERLRAAGAITIGKTNVPEFAAGSQTFNPVFGATVNPYDSTKTCGGSSGGAAVSLATGMLPIADGGDLGGSLRNPGNFNNVVGFRPSPGRVPIWPNPLAWDPFVVQGPLARTVADVALLLSAMAGPDARSPVAIREPGEAFRRPLERDFRGVRVAWAPDLGGLPVDSRVTAVLEGARPAFEALGCTLEPACPDFTDADEVFQVWRAFWFVAMLGELLPQHRDRMKDTVVWNIEEGLKLSGPALARAELKHTALFQRLDTFFERYDYLLCPVNQVPPFSIETPWVREINGVTMDTYIDWMRSAYWISITGHPAISVPAGFTDDGLPVGIQIVGRHQADFAVLQLAHAFEQATQVGRRRPPVAEG